MYRARILPEEIAGSYLGDFVLMNGQREAAALAYAEAALNWPTKSLLPEARIISLLAAVSGNGLDDFVLKHTEAPFIRATKSSVLSDRALISRKLNFCPICAREDWSVHGRSYARRLHQLDGIYWCAKHDFQPLLVAESHADLYGGRGEIVSGWQSWAKFSREEQNFFRRYFHACDCLFHRKCADRWLFYRYLFAKAKKLGLPRLKEAPQAKRPMFSDAVLARTPRIWLESFYPSWRFKSAGERDPAFDSSSFLGNRRRTELVCVLLAALYRSDRELDSLLSRAAFTPAYCRKVAEREAPRKMSGTLIVSP